MGCDGGSIPKRNEVVQTKQKQQKLDRSAVEAAKWFTCALSKRPLLSPIVACHYGQLYNKDAVYEYLLDPTSYGDGDVVCGHIRKPKKSDRFICPVTMREMNGTHRFCFAWSCGCVVSEQAMKEVPNGSKCLVCNKPFSSDDIYFIHPKPEELEIYKQRMQSLSQTKKKKKKREQDEPGVDDVKKQKISEFKSDGKTDAVPKIIQAKQTSAAIQSLYASSKKDSKNKETWLTKGTFTRYV